MVARKVTLPQPSPQSIAEAQKATGREPSALEISCPINENPLEQLARQIVGPRVASALVQSVISKSLLGTDLDLTSVRIALREASDRLNAGDLSDVKSMLFSQASSLNLLFAEMNRRAFKNLGGAYFEAGKQYMGLALKAQNQCRMTLETLGNIVNPPAVFAKQANIAHGPQQVNNGTNPRAPATENEISPNKLLEQINEQRMDIGTQGQAGGSNSTLEAVDAFDRTKVV